MMYKNYNHHLIFIILCQLLNVVFGQQFNPGPLFGHAAVYVEPRNNIYYIGGYNYNNPPEDSNISNTSSEFFYLDLQINSANFSKFIDLKSQGVNLPLSVHHNAEVGGVNQDSIFIIEGLILDEINNSTLYKFDTNTNELSVPVIQGNAPPIRKGMRSVSYEGKIYLFGGQTGSGTDLILFSRFDIFDTINLNWQVGSLVNSPVTRTLYTATLVKGVIYYIGGRKQRNNFSPITEIYQYDIVRNTWSLKTATTASTENMPGSRAGHSAILVDDKIYVYGGFFSSNDTSYDLPAKETLAILDSTTLVWSIPSLQNPNIPNLAYHTATIVNTLMIISFGNRTDLPNQIDQTNSLSYEFFLEDPQNILWYPMTSDNITDSQIPSSFLPDPNAKLDPQRPSSSGKMVLVFTSIGSVVVVLTIFVAISLAYRRTKRNKIRTDPFDDGKVTHQQFATSQ
ncbi:hypothetical protein C1645_741948 [Glomus cerebriforme]|uniref:Galactose oxidase n=1 Tax=Glomus cerebriforme TaxID=658196 RepID=A0A397SLH1_9GLOM|nr:hypothetical protein C1645_741948 [Glomus cerebriforme]